MDSDVVIYTTDYCGYCTRAKMLLAKKGVGFREINVGARPDLRDWLVETTGQRTVPQIFINGRSVGGFTELAGLDRGGELDRMLAAPPDDSKPPPRV